MVSQQSVETDPDLALDVFIVAIAIVPMPPVGWWSWYASAISVLDTDCKAHELDNLYIADASFFPSIAAVNPTLTIIANALRVADRIKERLQ